MGASRSLFLKKISLQSIARLLPTAEAALVRTWCRKNSSAVVTTVCMWSRRSCSEAPPCCGVRLLEAATRIGRRHTWAKAVHTHKHTHTHTHTPPTISYHIIRIPYHIISCRIISYFLISCVTHVISYHIVTVWRMSYHNSVTHVISYHIISYHTDTISYAYQVHTQYRPNAYLIRAKYKPKT